MTPDDADPFAALVQSAATAIDPPAGRDLLEAITVAGCRRALGDFVDGIANRHGPPALVAVLRGLERRVARFEDAWHPALGGLLHVRRNREAAFVSAVTVELALRAHALGEPGVWDLRFPAPSIVPFGSRRVDDACAIRVEADGRRIRIDVTTSDGVSSSLIEPVSGTDVWQIGCREPTLAPFPVRSAEDATDALWAVEPGMAGALADGLRVVDAASPPHAAWIRGAVRQVAPLARRGTAVASWSSLHYPGSISMTLFDSPLDMAETLVHEASHQWYHMLDRAFPLVDPAAADRTYWSPVKQTPRPLPMLLLAFHAFGNIALLFQALGQRGMLDAAGYRHQMSDLRAWLPRMADTLSTADGLTPEGDALWRHLYGRVEPALHEPEELTA